MWNTHQTHLKKETDHLQINSDFTVFQIIQMMKKGETVEVDVEEL